MKDVLFVLFACLLVSCSKQPAVSSAGMTIGVETNASIEEFIEEVTLVPLETNDECLLGELEKIHESDGCLYISDQRKAAVFVFDKSGKYLYKIERRGNGPEEYVEVSDFDVKDGVVYVLSNPSKRILAYDENGKCVKTIGLNAWYHYLVVEKNRVVLYANRANEQMYNVVIINHQGELLAQYLPYQKQDSYRRGGCGSPIKRMKDGEYLFTSYFSGKVASMKDGVCDYKYHFDFDVANKVSEEEMETMTYGDISDRLRWKESLVAIEGMTQDGEGSILMAASFFFDGKGLRDALCKVDLKTGTSRFHILGEKLEEKYPYLSGVVSMEGNKLYSYTMPFVMYRMHGNIGTPLPEGLNEDDNPVIGIYTLNLD